MNTCKCGREIPHRPNSTIKNKLCPKCTYEQALKRPRKSPEGRRTKISEKVKGSSYWMKKADLWFSRYIRISKGVVIEGEVYCEDIITGKMYAAKNIDCGHLHSRARMNTRYCPQNCWPQNRSSNRYRGEADKDMFLQNVIKKIGDKEAEFIQRMSEVTVSAGCSELKQKAEEYKEKVNQIIVEKKVNKWW
jgi:hypothetical protein